MSLIQIASVNKLWNTDFKRAFTPVELGSEMHHVAQLLSIFPNWKPSKVTCWINVAEVGVKSEQDH